ncbi:MAG: 3-phosphoserine/phosphohydroxythreonine transaminase [Flavipsychrobacter sp.]|nr:3-phosphoserine/phosphohydroxythreonine transaminase [Flavipsychrobacter sp.]
MSLSQQNIINFGSGPAALPQQVLSEAAEAILSYQGTGISVLSLPHRGAHFNAILEESKQLVRDITGIGADYEVLWLPGGGRLQFSMIPMNFLGEGQTAAYIDSGHWSAEAMDYAGYYGNIETLAGSRELNYRELPSLPPAIGHYAYLHYTTNNTIYGTQWNQIPQAGAPLVADMSSDIFSRPVPYTRYAMFYACAQKNIGPAGVTLAVVHRSLLERTVRAMPPMLSYAAHAAKNSVLNTPPVYAIYVSMLMLRWIKNKGIEVIQRENTQKAEALYAALDASTVFQPVVSRKDHRSAMNVCFRAGSEATGKAFVHLCARHGITGLEGHRSVGGLRVSLYNAITLQDVEKLVAVLKEFELISINK